MIVGIEMKSRSGGSKRWSLGCALGSSNLGVALSSSFGGPAVFGPKLRMYQLSFRVQTRGAVLYLTMIRCTKKRATMTKPKNCTYILSSSCLCKYMNVPLECILGLLPVEKCSLRSYGILGSLIFIVQTRIPSENSQAKISSIISDIPHVNFIKGSAPLHSPLKGCVKFCTLKDMAPEYLCRRHGSYFTMMSLARLDRG